MGNHIFYDEEGNITSIHQGIDERLSDEELIKKFGFLAGKGRSVVTLSDADVQKIKGKRNQYRYDETTQKIVKNK